MLRAHLLPKYLLPSVEQHLADGLDALYAEHAPDDVHGLHPPDARRRNPRRHASRPRRQPPTRREVYEGGCGRLGLSREGMRSDHSPAPRAS